MPFNPMVVDRSGEILAAGIVNAAQNISRSVELAAEQSAQNKKEAASLRGLLKIYDPDHADSFDAMGLDDLRERAAGVAAQGQMLVNRERRARADAAEWQLGQTQARTKFLGELAPLYPQGAPEEYALPAGPPPGPSQGDVLAAAQRTGYQPSAEEIHALQKSDLLKPGQVLNLGEGLMAVATTPSSVQPMRKPEPVPTGEPVPVMAQGKETGWWRFPDGQYRLLHPEKDAFNLAQFDRNQDGILNENEWVEAIKVKQLGMYPGMAIPGASPGAPGPGPAAAAGAAGGGNLYHRFKKWAGK